MSDRRHRAWWARAWLAWSLGGLGAAAAILVAIWAGWDAPQHVWWWWLAPGAAIGATLEVIALVDQRRHDTLSENIWRLGRGWRSLIATGCLWAAWLLATGDPWPSAGIAFLAWCAWHFVVEVPETTGG